MIDRHIAARIRSKRVAAGHTQAALANRLNLSQQQIRKYEAAINRVPAARLYLIAQILGASVSEFFDDIEAQESAPGKKEMR